MGETRAKVRFENELDTALCREGKLAKRKIRTATVDAIVDTGAVMILLPQDLVEKLGLTILDRTVVTLADDRHVEMDIAGTFELTIAGRKWRTDCLVGPPGCTPLIGQLVLERLDLIVDPLKRTVTPRPESPYLPTLNLKSSIHAAAAPTP